MRATAWARRFRVVTGGKSARDRLTYELVADTLPTTLADIGYFNIDQATGQITVARKLDADEVEAGRAPVTPWPESTW